MKITMERPNNQDMEIIKKQIKNKKLFVHSIGSRCKYGNPQILILNPIKSKKRKLLNFEAVSNIIWLSCPHLNKKIHEIEDAGGIGEIQNFVKMNRGVLEDMQSSHANFYFFRKNLYKMIMDEGFSKDSLKYFHLGVGGIKDPTSVKCLHMHYAHYSFCKSNVIGKLTDSLLHGNICCDERICNVRNNNCKTS